jgi:hypothetical protein
VIGTAGAGLRRGRVARAERERGRACAMWDGGASAGAGRAQKGARARGQATWMGISACVRAGPRWIAGKEELTERSHDTAGGSGRAGNDSAR